MLAAGVDLLHFQNELSLLSERCEVYRTALKAVQTTYYQQTSWRSWFWQSAGARIATADVVQMQEKLARTQTEMQHLEEQLHEKVRHMQASLYAAAKVKLEEAQEKKLCYSQLICVYIDCLVSKA